MPRSSTVVRTRFGSGFSEIDDFTIPLSNSFSLRISSDTKPCKWKTAELQKGLRLTCNETEMVGEGTGFGVPVLLYSDGMYFSGSSRLYVSRNENPKVIRKEFLMDRVPGRKFREFRLQSRKLLYVWKRLGDLYMNHRRWRFITQLSISRRIGVRTSFDRVHPVGKVIVTCSITNEYVRLKVDISNSKKKGLQRFFVLNEQGSELFRRYSDSNGTELLDSKIGAWETVDADSASITDPSGKFGFRLSQRKNTFLRRGREYIKGSQDWTGLDYEIDPKEEVFEYDIEILGVLATR